MNIKSSNSAIDASYIGSLKPKTLDVPIEEMRAKYNAEGYLWIKGLLPPQDVIDARRQYFEYLGPTGLTKSSSNPADGIFCGGDPRLVQALSIFFPQTPNTKDHIHTNKLTPIVASLRQTP
jgi:hypothetical protein